MAESTEMHNLKGLLCWGSF